MEINCTLFDELTSSYKADRQRWGTLEPFLPTCYVTLSLSLLSSEGHLVVGHEHPPNLFMISRNQKRDICFNSASPAGEQSAAEVFVNAVLIWNVTWTGRRRRSRRGTSCGRSWRTWSWTIPLCSRIIVTGSWVCRTTATVTITSVTLKAEAQQLLPTGTTVGLGAGWGPAGATPVPNDSTRPSFLPSHSEREIALSKTIIAS